LDLLSEQMQKIASNW